MKPLARRAVVWAVCAAILAAQWPASAWAAAGASEPNPVEAMTYLRSLGVYKDNGRRQWQGLDNPLKLYRSGRGE